MFFSKVDEVRDELIKIKTLLDGRMPESVYHFRCPSFPETFQK